MTSVESSPATLSSVGSVTFPNAAPKHREKQRRKQRRNSPTRAPRQHSSPDFSTEQLQIALEGMRSENAALAKKLTEATQELQITVEAHKQKQRNPSTMTRRATRKVMKKVRAEAQLRERLLSKTDGVRQTARIKQLEAAIETVADQHDELVKDTRILQQACARHEKMFVRGDADKRRRENEFRVAVQQNEALKHKAHLMHKKMLRTSDIHATEARKLTQLTEQLDGYDHGLHTACLAAHERTVELRAEKRKLSEQIEKVDKVLNNDRKRNAKNASNSGGDVKELKAEVERLTTLMHQRDSV